MDTPNKQEITSFLQELQDNICAALEAADGKAHFIEDQWSREGGGGGRSRIIQGGNIIEKGGVGFSAVYGKTPENILKALHLEEADFYATGVSIVLHPKSPMVPIIHMNVRYFEMSNGTYWFGGGIDLTPHYIVKDDARWFHQQLKSVCDKHGKLLYPEFKDWADNYFYSKHRNETRGVGGIFFDHLKENETFTKRDRFNFLKDVGNVFAPIYTHFMKQNSSIPFGEKETDWQSLRRSRYVEFNLLWDKGTKFGLDTNGRTESILMSMPPTAKWVYNYQAEPGSKEAETLSLLQKGLDWLA